MKYLLFTSVLSGGGAERVLCQLANRLAAENEVLLTAAYRTEHEYQLSDSVRKVYIDVSAENRHPFRQIFRLRKMIRREKPDVCLSFLPQPNFKLLLAAFGLNTKVVVSVRNDPAREYANWHSKLLARILYPMAGGVVFQTGDAQKWFSRRIQAKSRVIMNQVDERFFSAVHKADVYFVATGRLNAQKNYPVMIRAFAAFSEQYPKEQLRIYGAGEQKEALQKLIEEVHAGEHIQLMGSSEDIPGVLAHAKAFVLSSDYEGMPNGLLEAMAVGLPCISTDCPCGGPRAVIENRRNGVLIPTGSVDGLYRALVEYQEDQLFRQSCAKRAKESASQFHPDIIFSQWEQFLKETAGR